MPKNRYNNTEEVKMGECDGEKVVTMMDVLQEQEDFEEDANAVLGASDDKECTYPKGYIKRQAVYACLTCCSEAKNYKTLRAGVCLACSLNCHENHELIELYTKRNFRCDCGNPKFNSHPCQFIKNKADLNMDNKYNQNFSGLYCVCSRPYPDPECTVEEDMIQCIVCEDWLHASHLEAVVPPGDQYAEMICKDCMEQNEFLHDYSGFAVNILENEDVDIVNDSAIEESSICNGESQVNGINESMQEEPFQKPDTGMKNVEESMKFSEVKDIINDNADDMKVPINEQVTEENKDPPKDEKTEQIDDSVPESLAEKTTDISNKDNEMEDEFNKENVSFAKVKDSFISSVNEGKDNLTDVVPTEHMEEHNISPVTKKVDENQSNDSVIESESVSKLSSHEETQIGQCYALDTKISTIPDEPGKEDTTDESQSAASNDFKISLQTETKENEVTTTESTDDNKEIDAIDKLLEEDIPKQSCEKTDNLPEGHIEEKKHMNTDNETTEKTAEAQPVQNYDEINKAETEQEKRVDVPHDTISIKGQNDENRNVEENIATELSEKKENSSSGISEESSNLPNDIEPPLIGSEETCKENKRKLSPEEAMDDQEEITKKPKLECDIKACIRPKGVVKKFKGATFWPSNFRQKLCTCNECISMYKDLSVLFLIDLEDTVAAYEALGKEKTNGTATTQYEQGLQALSSLDRIQQINALTEYNNMRDKLLDFLKSFKDRKEVVKEEDIKAFFAGMKPRREPDGVYFCR